MRKYCVSFFVSFIFVISGIGNTSANDLCRFNAGQGQYDLPCDSFKVKINPQAETFNFCPGGQEITFSGEAWYAIEGFTNYNAENFVFNWEFNGIAKTGPNVTYDLPETGAYVITVSVFDPQNVCSADTFETVKVGTVPVFNDTHPAYDVLCAKEPNTLYGNAQAVTWTGFQTSVIETVAIPDGTGANYSSSISFDVFDNSAVIQSIEDFDRICLNIEHVNQNQLTFRLQCPNGNSVLLKNTGGWEANLGEPVVWDNVTHGIPYQYCFNTTPEYGTMDLTTPNYHEYTDNAGNYYFNAPYLPAANYSTSEPLENLIGCPLNGEWSLTVNDNLEGENGFVYGWSLFFNETFYPDSLIFTPQIVSELWFDGTLPLEDNPASVTKEEEGIFNFTFRVTDDFGCSYDTTFQTEVLPLPEAEILSDKEIPVCEGDSVLLSINYISGTQMNWVYEWQFGGTAFENRTSDTLWGKAMGTYGLGITDTITTCFNYFSLDVSDQNCDLTIPNVFTPNGDNINDKFEITNLEHYPNSQMVIYNRWGQKVFEHSDYYNNWWDGENAAAGVYYYILVYTHLGKKKHLNGMVTILR